MKKRLNAAGWFWLTYTAAVATAVGFSLAPVFFLMKVTP